jgi:acetyltransferase
MEFFSSHTPETVHDRYGYSISDMSPERASALVGVDQAWDLALGIFGTGPSGGRLDAVGRFCRDPDGRGAEFALVVRENRRHLGMGSLLLKKLIEVAAGRGLDRLWGQISADNAAMLDLARRLGFALSEDEDRCIRAVRPLRPAAKPKRRGS